MIRTLATALSRALRAFPSDRRGGIQILLGLALIPLMGGIGLAIDASRGYLVKARLSEAVDAAALAGARSLHLDTWQEDVNRFFAANFPTGYLDATLQPLTIASNSEDQTLEVVAQASVPTTFMKILNVSDFDVEVRTVVSGERRGLELALVLDVTGSMDGSKIAALKTAGVNLLNILYGENDTLDDLFVSVVPFAGRVNVGNHDSWFSSTPWYYEGCGDPRGSGLATSDDTSAAGLWDPFYNSYYYWNRTYGCPDDAILPLTASKSAVTGAINGLDAYGNTRTDIGIVWGWRVLSPKWRGLWGDANLPLDYDEELMDKALIIMTDGENTPWLSGDSISVNDTNSRLLEVCTAMKAEGITVFTITFQAPPTLDPVFSACASGAGNHFTSPTEEDLNAAFQQIATQLSNLRITE